MAKSFFPQALQDEIDRRRKTNTANLLLEDEAIIEEIVRDAAEFSKKTKTNNAGQKTADKKIIQAKIFSGNAETVEEKLNDWLLENSGPDTFMRAKIGGGEKISVLLFYEDTREKVLKRKAEIEKQKEKEKAKRKRARRRSFNYNDDRRY